MRLPAQNTHSVSTQQHHSHAAFTEPTGHIISISAIRLSLLRAPTAAQAQTGARRNPLTGARRCSVDISPPTCVCFCFLFCLLARALVFSSVLEVQWWNSWLAFCCRCRSVRVRQAVRRRDPTACADAQSLRGALAESRVYFFLLDCIFRISRYVEACHVQAGNAAIAYRCAAIFANDGVLGAVHATDAGVPRVSNST